MALRRVIVIDCVLRCAGWHCIAVRGPWCHWHFDSMSSIAASIIVLCVSRAFACEGGKVLILKKERREGLLCFLLLTPVVGGGIACRPLNDGDNREWIRSCSGNQLCSDVVNIPCPCSLIPRIKKPSDEPSRPNPTRSTYTIDLSC